MITSARLAHSPAGLNTSKDSVHGRLSHTADVQQPLGVAALGVVADELIQGVPKRIL
jgi:hypothetical protein